MKHFNISTEDNDIVNTNKDSAVDTIKEKEYIVYFRTLDFKQLENATHAEKQTQWTVFVPKDECNASDGKIRVRETIDINGKTEYSLTIKNKVKDGNIESTLSTSKEVFTQVAFLAKEGSKKHRYIFPIEGSSLQWEIDVYPDGNGGYYPWGRAELEVKEELSQLPQLPISVEETIMPEEAATEEGKNKVKDLFDKFFIVPNPYIPSKTPLEPQEDDIEEEEGENTTQDENVDSNASESDSDSTSDDDNTDGNTTGDNEDNKEEQEE